MSTLFQTLELEAFRKGITPRTKESREWFRKRISDIKTVNRSALMNEDPLELKNRQIAGGMFMFFYDPKHKKTLPYYDSFPLVIVLDKAEGGFLGLNLHYLPPLLRAKFLDSLMADQKSPADKTKGSFNVKALSSSKYFKPCIKHYLTAHVRSRFAYIPAPEWEIATCLPTADWQKASAGKVYSDSRGML